MIDDLKLLWLKLFYLLRTLPGVGHFLMLEQPKLWAQNILDFIS